MPEGSTNAQIRKLQREARHIEEEEKFHALHGRAPEVDDARDNSRKKERRSKEPNSN